MTDAWTLGYGTNGFSDHTLDDALDVIQAAGYGAVALTLGHPHIDPFAEDWRSRVEALATDLDRRGLRVVVETGARYLLDPLRKHRPTLVDVDAEPRMAFLRRAIEIAAVLDADCVSLWSGVLPHESDPAAAWTLLTDRLAQLVPFAQQHGVVLSIEPEPGMLVETVADALRLRAAIGDPASVGITVDLGHCVAVEPEGVTGALRQAGSLLRNVQIDDMRPGVHEHLELGTGELDLVAAIETLREIGYAGVAAVELPRHSHDAPRLAFESKRVWDAAAGRPRHPWTAEAVEVVTADPSRAARLFAQASRAVGRDELDTLDARAAIVEALHGADADAAVVRDLYDHGDNAERRGVLRGFEVLSLALDDAWRETGIDLTKDALRANDPALVAAAMGGFAHAQLDDHAWRHGVLKLVFMGVPLSAVAGLNDRRDAELAAMATRYAEERRAAGRSIPDDLRLIDTFSQE